MEGTTWEGGDPLGTCCLGSPTMPAAVAPAPGPASQAARAVPGAPEWRTPQEVVRGANTLSLPRHLPHANTSSSNLLRSGPSCPLAPSAASSAPASPLPMPARSPLVASALPLLGDHRSGLKGPQRRVRRKRRTEADSITHRGPWELVTCSSSSAFCAPGSQGVASVDSSAGVAGLAVHHAHSRRRWHTGPGSLCRVQ